MPIRKTSSRGRKTTPKARKTTRKTTKKSLGNPLKAFGKMSTTGKLITGAAALFVGKKAVDHFSEKNEPNAPIPPFEDMPEPQPGSKGTAGFKSF